MYFGNKPDISFFTRPVLETAPDLLGKILVRKTGDNVLAGRITETEAYDGSIDEAAHTFGGKTPRNSVMFNQGGLLYVYFTYGVHHCCNVVTGCEGEGNAVLIRSLEPLEGLEVMAYNRFGSSYLDDKIKTNLTTGPGKLCKAFNITLADNGENLVGDSIFIADDGFVVDKKDIHTTTRIGIRKSAELPWRFYLKNNRFISRK